MIDLIPVILRSCVLVPVVKSEVLRAVYGIKYGVKYENKRADGMLIA